MESNMRALWQAVVLFLVANLFAKQGANARVRTSPSIINADDVCSRWNHDRSNMSPVTWAGTFNCALGRVNMSDPGEINDSDKDRMIVQLNLYRWLVGFTVPISHGGTFPTDMKNPGYPQYKSSWAGQSRNGAAQACAYMLGSNSGIHFGHDDYCFVMGHIGTFQPDCGGVDPSDPAYKCHCYTYANDEATFLGGIAAFDGVVAMDAYVVDYGSISSVPLGHRRLMFAQHLGPVGVGAVGVAAGEDRPYSCLSMVTPEVAPEVREWVAFPGPGYIPHEALYPYGTPRNCSAVPSDCWARNNDYMGWHFQSQRIDLAGATVEILTQDALDNAWVSAGPQREALLAPAVGVAGVDAGNTLVFGADIIPSKGVVWASQPGKFYRVTITLSTSRVIQYDFGVVACDSTNV
eukprot:m.272269 g.272269  ORF g.272269 m.272269 type:complete len:406 (-) comp100528_c0_seq1:80-1297(-)